MKTDRIFLFIALCVIVLLQKPLFLSSGPENMSQDVSRTVRTPPPASLNNSSHLLSFSLNDWRVTAVCIILLGVTLVWNRRLAKEVRTHKQAERQRVDAWKLLESRIETRTMELTRANQALHDRAELFRALVEHAPNILFSTDVELTVTYINHTLPSLTPDDVIGRSIYEFTPPDEVPRVREFMKHLFSTGESVNYESGSRREHGEYWLDVSVSPIQEHDQIVGTIFILTDISKRKRAEESLRESEKRLQKLFDTMTEGVVLIAPDGRLIQANPAAERILGLIRSEIEERDYVSPEWEIQRPDGTPMPPEEMAGPRAMHEKRPIRNVVMGVKRPEGNISWINVNATPLINDAGELDGAVETFTDITTHKQTEEDLRLFKTVIESSEEAIAISAPDGTLLYINPAHEKLFGRSLEEARQCNYRDYYPPESIEELNTRVAPALAHGKSWEGELDVFDADGRRFPLWERAGSIFDSVGNMVCAFGLMHDVTKQKQTENMLRETNEILEKIFSTTHFCLVFLDRQCNFIRVNQAYADVCGHELNFFSGKNHFDLYPHQENEAIFRRVAQTGEPYTVYAKPFEFPDHPEWGTTYWDWTLHPVKDARGAVEGLIFALVNVTERKLAELALKEHRTHLEELVAQRTHELEARTEELKTFNRTMVDREMRIIEMKEEVNRLCEELEREPVYPPVWKETRDKDSGL